MIVSLTEGVLPTTESLADYAAKATQPAQPCDVCGEPVAHSARRVVLKLTGEVWRHPHHTGTAKPV